MAAGYTATGTPRWESFASRCLALVPERAGQLFGARAETFAIVHSGGVLCDDLMPEFGRNSDGFSLLAQLDLGFFELGRERICASFQALRIHPAAGQERVVLHSIGLTSLELEAEPAELGGLDPQPLRDLLRATQERLRGLVFRRVGLARADESLPSVEELAVSVLTKLKGGLERMFRQRERRTHHAEERSQEAGRPVEQALPDAGAARDDELLIDTHRNTVVVLGPRGRIHIFSPVAQLVTSLKLDRDAVRRRVARERWRAATPEESSAFRIALQARLNRGEVGELTGLSLS